LQIFNNDGSLNQVGESYLSACKAWADDTPGPSPGPTPVQPPGPKPALTMPPTPAPKPACKVGDHVRCPDGSSHKCAGNQCCPDGSTCPSASKDFRCPKPKKADCISPSLSEVIDAVNANCAADTANCILQGCCKTSGHKCFMKDAHTAFCRSGSPPASWFGHELRKSTAPNGVETWDDRPIIFDEQVQDGPPLGGVASVVSPNLVMAGVAMMFMMGASLIAIKLRRWRQPSFDGRGMPQLLRSHEEDMEGLQ